MKVLMRLVIISLVLLMAGPTYGEIERRTAKILDMEGDIQIISEGGKDKFPADVGMKLYQGDIIITKPGSWAYLKINGIKKATVEVKENSQLLLLEMVMDKEKGTQNTLLDLALGKLMVTVEEIPSEKPNFEVKTPTTVIGTMGDGESSFSVEVEALN